ncbi:TetR/AcrR family transcriptional regulator [Nonomuraea zeae]|uniref:TetR/AcrR family transcriptional regulator n=1 Tax=Nonomuraea zeae TaxID=1642303 RepID=UPI0014781A73|nr:TetR/AcrR family transcriptional regulator [Nonomuraea zeae]
MKTPPPDLAGRLLEVGEQVLRTDPPPRLEDVALLVGASRATLYYYFSGRDDLLAFLLTAHVMRGAEAIRGAAEQGGGPEARLRAAVAAMIGYLGRHPGICAGLLSALGASGRMEEVLRANDTWIAGPVRELLDEGSRAGVFTTGEVSDAANAILGAVLLGVLGRSSSAAADDAFCRCLTDQVVRGVLTS